MSLQGIVFAVSTAQTLVSFRYRPYGAWKTTNCATVCLNRAPVCLVDCVELQELSNSLYTDTNGEDGGNGEGEFWFNQTGDLPDD